MAKTRHQTPDPRHQSERAARNAGSHEQHTPRRAPARRGGTVSFRCGCGGGGRRRGGGGRRRGAQTARALLPTRRSVLMFKECQSVLMFKSQSVLMFKSVSLCSCKQSVTSADAKAEATSLELS
eukprot:3052736-Rhodomonas_salina.1